MVTMLLQNLELITLCWNDTCFYFYSIFDIVNIHKKNSPWKFITREKRLQNNNCNHTGMGWPNNVRMHHETDALWNCFVMKIVKSKLQSSE